MKLKPKPWRLIWRFLLLLLVIIVVIFASSLSLFIDFKTGQFIPWDFRQYLIIALMVGIGVVAFIPAITSYWYKIEDKFFIVHKYGKEIEYSYENIIFVNEEVHEKKKMVHFYHKQVKMVYLLTDKDDVLYKTLLKKCKNLLSKEEFYSAHPEER